MPRWLPLAILVCALPAAAQIRTPGASAVSEHSGPIGADSAPVGAGSRSMYEGVTIGESSGRHPNDRRTGGPVRDGRTRSMRSGPVSSISSGPMTQPRTLPDGGSMTQHSAGAVKHDIARPLGSRISQPLRELAPLQAHLRQLREHGNDAAVAAAQAPAAADPAPALDHDGAAEMEEEPPRLAEHAAEERHEDAARPAAAPVDEGAPAGSEDGAPPASPANAR